MRTARRGAAARVPRAAQRPARRSAARSASTTSSSRRSRSRSAACPSATRRWEGDAIRHYHRVHVGVAVAIEDGLVTPVVRDADQKGIGAIAAEVRDLAERAKTSAAQGPRDHRLDVHGLEPRHVRHRAVHRDHQPARGRHPRGRHRSSTSRSSRTAQIVAGKRMTVTMSCDHRVIDGALGAQWLAGVRRADREAGVARAMSRRRSRTTSS